MLICRGTDTHTHTQTHGRMENIYSIFRDKLLLQGEHVLVDILVDYSEMILSNVVGDVNYGSLVQMYCLTVIIYIGIKWTWPPDLMLKLFLSNKIFKSFISVVYLNLFLANIVVSPAIYFVWVPFLFEIVQLSYILIMCILLSSASRLNSNCFLTLLTFNRFKSSKLFLCSSFVPLRTPYESVLLPQPSPPTIATNTESSI